MADRTSFPTPWITTGPGIDRRILCTSPEQMLVEYRVHSGAVGESHKHFCAQSIYVTSGRFKFTISSEDRILEAGDAVIASPNTIHSLVCLDEGWLIGAFAPQREDILEAHGLT